jgi:N-acetylglucosaminyldiphosphoundecaprenol N-acetyl-beta-D-mannosaminyltransferase
MTKTLREKYPNIIVAGTISPPFRSIEEKELEQYIISINAANPNFIFVGLGCPKQEKWMAENFNKINAVLLGVGGAFLTTAGLQKRAPYWMQKSSLEWLYRLIQEPQRLFKRYLVANSLFIYLLTKSLLKKLFYGEV